jgi:intracellular septation protein
MLALLDFLPLLAFGVAYWLADFRTAVLVIMVAMAVQIVITWVITRTVNRMLLASAGLVIGLGTISLLLKNDLIFKWKPTVLNGLFAAVLLATQYVGDRPGIQRLLQSVAREEIHLTNPEWRTLNLMWVVYFIVAGVANIVVAYRFSESAWVNFKVFGLIGMTLAFLVIQAWWLSRRPGMAERHAETD